MLCPANILGYLFAIRLASTGALLPCAVILSEVRASLPFPQFLRARERSRRTSLRSNASRSPRDILPFFVGARYIAPGKLLDSPCLVRLASTGALLPFPGWKRGVLTPR